MQRASNGARTVLAGVDQEPGWQSVVRFAADEAQRRGMLLRLLHAVEWPLPPGSGGPGSPEERAALVVGAAAALVHREFPQVAVEESPASGRPATVLVERSRSCDLVVVGHRGRAGLARLPLGSVGVEVAWHAGCPVVVVRADEAAPPVPPERVVVGVEHTGACESAVDFAFAEAELRDARLELLHADARSSVLAPRGGAGPPDRHHRELRDTATARRPRFPRVRVDVRVEHARPGPTLRAAAAPGALVVVGSHGHSGLRRLLLGSVSGALLHAATGPVAVVPARWPG